jgi:glycosyltransferase involved in cell wall biosynthesis
MSKVLVLLSTYNGAKYLKEQLDSLFSQTHKDFEIIARDDCSSDETLEILQFYNIKILQAKENLGAKISFSTLLEYAVNNTNSEYFMFCDQDDIWDEDKIENTLVKMQDIERLNTETSVLIHTDLKVVDKNLNMLNKSFMSFQSIDAKYNKLNNLLIQNTVTGCTMMINRKLVTICLPIPKEAIMHDWWIGLVASKFGHIEYLNRTTISYRQHANNSIGAKKLNLKYMLEQILKSDLLLENIHQAEAFLNIYREEFDKNTISMLEDFSDIKSKSFFTKRLILWKYKLLKQGFIRNIGLFLKI